MSRVGKQPITIPDAVTLDVKDNVVTAKGPKGELSVAVNKEMKLTQKDGVLTVERPNEEKQFRAMHGLYRSLVNNIVEGVSNGFEKRLEVGAKFLIECGNFYSPGLAQPQVDGLDHLLAGGERFFGPHRQLPLFKIGQPVSKAPVVPVAQRL